MADSNQNQIHQLENVALGTPMVNAIDGDGMARSDANAMFERVACVSHSCPMLTCALLCKLSS